MASVGRFEKCLVFSSGMRCAVFQVGSTECRVVEVPHPYKVCSDDEGDGSPEKPKRADGQSKESAPSADEAHVRCVSISPCGKWLALCDDYKQLSLWRLCSLELASIRSVLRRTSQIIFSNTSDCILVADKSGDVYSFSVENPTEDGKLLLGHVSMLLDILISHDGKHIITCDRDEKIRVSWYPNAYNISGYCLGHREFVTQIALLPHCPRVLVSGSGDGTFRFWDYAQCRQLEVVDCPEDEVEVDEVQEVNEGKVTDTKNGDHDKPDKQDVVYPKPAIKCFCFQQVDETRSIMATCIHRLKGVLLYTVCGGLDDLAVTPTQKLTLEAEPWDLLFMNQHTLLALLPIEGKILHYFLSSSNLEFTEPASDDSEMSRLIQTVNSNWEFFKDALSVASNIPNLYKRWYDNMKDYMEKKKERLESSGGSSGGKVPGWRGPPSKRPKVQ